MGLRRAGTEMKTREPTDLQDRILERMQTNGPATAGSLAKALGVAEEFVLSALLRCRKRGLVQLDEKFRWSINPKFTSHGRGVNCFIQRIRGTQLPYYFSNHSRQAQIYFFHY